MKFGPLIIYKLSKKIAYIKVPVIPHVLDYINRLIFSCWIPHTCTVGSNLVLGYQGLAIVIHKDAVIGNNVHIDQCVTIGGNGTEFGVPVVGSNIYIGSGAKILGPISIGNGSIVGANSVVIKDVPENTVVAGVPAKVIKENIKLDDVLYHLKNK